MSTHLAGILDQERKWLGLNTDVYYFESQNIYTGSTGILTTTGSNYFVPQYKIRHQCLEINPCDQS